MGAFGAPPDPLTGFKRPTSKGMEEREDKGQEAKERKGEGGDGWKGLGKEGSKCIEFYHLLLSNLTTESNLPSTVVTLVPCLHVMLWS